LKLSSLKLPPGAHLGSRLAARGKAAGLAVNGAARALPRRKNKAVEMMGDILTVGVVIC